MPKQYYKGKSVLKKERCKNCGSSEHTTKDCLERPKKYGCKSSVEMKDIQKSKLKQEEIKELINQTEEITKEIQNTQNRIDCKEYYSCKEEEEMIENEINKKRMAIKNLRRRDDIAPYLKDLKDKNDKIKQEIDDMKELWDKEEDKTKRNEIEFL
ncbi:hypothetical protein EDI_347060 [Entamoeba dispar SAW760]|uniref:CCHC-type domain-containing protein n=1 Tax=Entamoeba dispar (strain ATCC PRA-260 / SAW760) TaxID=370354 RepID=B0EPM5_ENTDS|nr:uncharacterized protein EDI_347060 [Entamoeba dispar SAW760]EDR23521.1 hypothetical protein EDI_347060 [Entamoeba dispar SAW760]|eukprot:EDR23521.1 hypothetical protein EDI_347060 [Entamoeba dispar SAW760]